MPADLVFKGDFSFVNVDASSLSTLPHRQQVTRHVHGYRRWKKGQEARRLRESSRFHEPVESKSTSQRTVPRHTFRRDRQPHSPAVPVLPITIRTLPSLIDVILLNGNSDPFDALPEQLTATVNSLLGFERDCIFPSIKELESRMTPRRIASRESTFTATWINDSTAYLYDNIAIHSYLARIATHRYMFTSQPEFLDAAHEFRRKGVASLKEYMTNTPQLDIPRLYRALLILLWADSALGDRNAFQHHVTVLKDIFQSHHDVLSADPSFHVHHFVSIVYFEVQFAVMTLSSIPLDLSHNEWVEKQLTSLWSQVSPSFPFSKAEADRSLDHHLEGDVRSLYLDAQEILDIIRLMRTNSLLHTSLTWAYAMSKTILTVGRLVNLYANLDIENVLLHPSGSNPNMQTVQKLETAAACLCAMYWLRELAGIENVYMTDKMKLFAWNPIMLNRLDRLVSAYSELSSHDFQHVDDDGSLRLLLWLSWTGAMAEQSMLSPFQVGDDQDLFTKHFRELCSRAEIRSLPQCQRVLDQFLQLHDMRPDSGDDWYIRCFPQVGGRRTQLPIL
ncbi:hypothetical protein H2200_001285 [Cladophialophora chaetospira]|uniref:Uncharacterized protein n=1 Tax=Cladophialophora chaetospira TaxID=386627 RepID=A0AA38XKQ0_9EURO|nr:hypothetical protein H2200_001285 [Cladophialophora chaetospira]